MAKHALTTSEALLILGDQLFAPSHLKEFFGMPCFMAEDIELCTHYRYHKQKLVLFLSAMRHFREENRKTFEFHYSSLDEPGTYFEKLDHFVTQNKIAMLHHFEVEDKFFESRLNAWAANKVKLREHQSPAFFCSRQDFKDYLSAHKRPFQKSFYEGQRKKHKILLQASGEPVGGVWSLDKENRKPYKSKESPPRIPQVPCTPNIQEVQALVERRFSHHPGRASDFSYPVTRKDAEKCLEQFVAERLENFGAYEDAIHSEHAFLFHSVLSPSLNAGLLTPQQVVESAVKAYEEKNLPLASIEGFVRQVIGWRDFIRGIYRNFSEVQERGNFWGHQRKLKPCWYEASTGIPPLDDMIRKVQKYAYAHHIERLMIAGNIMLLCRLSPGEAHRWFMEMFIDSADWVMGPNVYGMSQFSDGGIFATKPYICASNYILKMSNYPRGEWCDDLDALYWTFIADNLKFFQSQPRLSMMANLLKKKTAAQIREYRSRSKSVIDRLTHPPQGHPSER